MGKEKPYPSGGELRYNPRIVKPVARVYLPWFFGVSLFLILAGVASVGCAIAAREIFDDIHNELFQLWVGIPIAAIGLFGILLFMTKSRRMVILYLMLSLIIMIICATAALMGGLRFWSERWSLARRRVLEDGKCSVVNNACACSGVNMPAQIKTCGDVKNIANLIIAQLALSTCGFFLCMAAVYLSMMAICCGPWQYMDENSYDKNFDPDITNPNNIKIRSTSPLKSGTSNPGFSG